MALWILLVSMVLFAVTFIGLVKHPVWRYSLSAIFLALSIFCSVSLMLNDTKHLGMNDTTVTRTEKLISTTGKNSQLKLTAYKSLGDGSEKIFVYRTANQPNKSQHTKIDYDVTTEVKHTNTATPELKIKEQRHVYKNDFWKIMFIGLGLNKEIHHYTYVFEVPKDWLVLSTTQLQAMKGQEATMKAQLAAEVKAQLPALVKAKMMEAMEKDPNMSNQQKQALEKQITAEQEKELVNKLTQQAFSKMLPQLEKESL